MDRLAEFTGMILRCASLPWLLTAFAVSAQSPKTRKHSPATQSAVSVRIDVVEPSEDLHESLLESRSNSVPLAFRGSPSKSTTPSSSSKSAASAPLSRILRRG